MNLESYLDEISEQLSKPKEEIRELLKTKFGVYNQAHTNSYTSYLRLYYGLVEIEPKANICPICGDETTPDNMWNSKYRKLPGWRCKTGGLRHYLEWRTNMIVEDHKKAKEKFYGDGYSGTVRDSSELERYYWYVIYEYHPERVDQFNLR